MISNLIVNIFLTVGNINQNRDRFHRALYSVSKTSGKEREVIFNPQKYLHHHLGYATSNYRSQGMGAERALVFLLGIR
ncbi:MAG: hypothetical protein ACQEP8_04510 [Chlamydiota bacterium]